MNTASMERYLLMAPLFQTLEKHEIRSLVRHSLEKSFKAGTTIVREGENGVGFYLILGGQVEVRKNSQSLSRIGSGEFFGELSLFQEDVPRSADVVALEDTTCLMLKRWDLRSLIAAHPDIALKMLAELSRRLSATSRALKE